MHKQLAVRRDWQPALPRSYVLRPFDAVTLGKNAIVKAATYEASHGTGFLLATVLVGIGIIAHAALATALPLWLVAVLFVLSLAAWILTPWYSAKPFFLGITLLSAGIGTASLQEIRLSTPMVGSVINTTLTARVLRIETRDDGSLRYLFEVKETARPTLRYAPERVLITQRSKEVETIEVGDLVQARVRLMPANGPVMPGSYDFGFNAYFRGIGGSGFVMGKLAIVEKRQGTGSAALVIERMRTHLAGHIRSRIEGVDGEIAAALIAGVRSGIPDDINEALRQTGLAHILSISGLHMAMVAGFVMASLRIAFACIPAFASRYPVKKLSAVLALLVASFYLALSGADVAAQRSYLMIAIMLIAILFDRAALTLRNVAISALIIFAWSPHEVFGPSFQMSYAATVALIVAYGAWKRRKRSNGWWFAPQGSLIKGFIDSIATLSMTSIVAGLATALYGAYHFYRVSPLSLPANLLTMPATSVFMPAGVLGVIAMPFGLDAPFFWVMGKGIAVMNAIAIWLASISPQDAVGRIPEKSLIALTIAFLVLTLFRTRLLLLSIPIGLLGCIWLFQRAEPDILISENGKIVGARLSDGRLALNTMRGSSFTVNNWRYATQSNRIERPVSSDKPNEAIKGFRCHEKRCHIALAGYSVWTVENAIDAEPLCDQTQLIIVSADATAQNLCANTNTQIITLRDLARRGAANVFLPGDGPHAAPGQMTLGAPEKHLMKIVHSIDEPYRAWHSYRQYSREARGMSPYQPRPRGEPTKEPAKQRQAAEE